MNPAAISEMAEMLVSMGIARDDAIACLKACNNDPNQAAEYYWGGGLQKSRDSLKWDEAAFSAPREGESEERSYQNNWQHPDTSFQIQGQDVLSPNIFNSGTKTRPPSPANNVDPNEDPELAQALAASMHGVPDVSQFGPQESGITGTHTSPTNSTFLPAPPNKDYDPSKWALTTTETHEDIRDAPEPKDRMRNPGCPAFIRPSGYSYNLGGVLTILHSIPRARDAFLARDFVKRDYGSEPQWWRGEQIPESRIIDEDDVQNGLNNDAEDVLAEVQRLMAFLDSTNRAYGSADVLSELPRVKETEKMSIVPTFLKNWHECVAEIIKNGTLMDQAIFSSIAHQVQTDPEIKERLENFQVLELSVSRGDSNLHCALSNVVWADEKRTFVDFADVICISLKSEAGTPGTGIDIPAILYPDRYTEPWLPQVEPLKASIFAGREKLIDLNKKEQRLKSFRTPRNPFRDPRSLLEATIAHFATPITKPSTDDGADDIHMDSQLELPDPTPMLKELLRKIEKKITNFEQQRKDVHAQLNEMKNSFTTPETTSDEYPPLTAYSLRGVCAGQFMTYILLPHDPDTHITVDSDAEQWWYIDWHETPQSIGWNQVGLYEGYTITKVTEAEVLNAAKTIGDNTFLIYANENAFKDADDSLPEALKAFVEADNALFEAELNPRSESPPVLPSPGKKRRLSEKSFGSPKRQDIVEQEVELPMMERSGHISPVAKAFQLGTINERIPDSDYEMLDVEHVERADSGLEERKGG